MSKLKLGVLISGRGSNMGALARATIDPDFPAEIVVVASNRPNVAGLDLATEHDIPVAVRDHNEFADRDDHDAAMTEILQNAGVELVCLAGYMRIVGDTFLKQWAGRLINIHPSLLPAFRGRDTHERALERGCRVHGCTVHYVNSELDGGPIIAQSVVPVLPDDDAEALGARVLEAEHRLYPHAVRLIANRVVRWRGNEPVRTRANASEPLAFFPKDEV